MEKIKTNKIVSLSLQSNTLKSKIMKSNKKYRIKWNKTMILKLSQKMRMNLSKRKRELNSLNPPQVISMRDMRTLTKRSSKFYRDFMVLAKILESSSMLGKMQI